MKCRIPAYAVAPLVRSRTPSTVDRSWTGAQRMRAGLDVARPSYFSLVMCVLCVFWLLLNLRVFSVRRILDYHPCVEILSVFSPGQSLNCIINRPRQFQEYYCSDGDSVRSAFSLDFLQRCVVGCALEDAFCSHRLFYV